MAARRVRIPPSGALPLSALAALALAACATARGPAATAPPCVAAGAPCEAGAAGAGGASPAGQAEQTLAGQAMQTLDPQLVEVTPLDLELAGKNDEELFAIGQAAYAAGELERAATAFSRLADLHPGSRHQAAALFDAGLSWQRLERWRAALERFLQLDRAYDGPDADEAAFKAAECHYHLGELAEARALLDRLARRADLPAEERVRALAQRGVVELEAGLAAEAEQTLRLAVSTWRGAGERERLDAHWASQAQFYLGEVYRGHFLAVALDPSRDGEEALARALEDKASLLLSAQGHYLRTIRMGDADWAVAAGFRVGELYDALHAALLEAPLPPGLDEEEAEAYRAELRRKVRVLVTKAITIYEQTLAVAGRARLQDQRFLDQTRASLERMKRALADTPPDAATVPEPALPPDAEPGKG